MFDQKCGSEYTRQNFITPKNWISICFICGVAWSKASSMILAVISCALLCHFAIFWCFIFLKVGELCIKGAVESVLAEFSSEKLLEIVQHFPKLWANVGWHVFLTHSIVQPNAHPQYDQRSWKRICGSCKPKKSNWFHLASFLQAP